MDFVCVPISRKEYEQLNDYDAAYRLNPDPAIFEQAAKVCYQIENRTGFTIPVRLGGPAFLSKVGRQCSLLLHSSP